MIIVTAENNILYNRINAEEDIVFYPDLFSGKIAKKFVSLSKSHPVLVEKIFLSSLKSLTGQKFTSKKEEMLSKTACITFENKKLTLTNECTGKKEVLSCKVGSLILIRSTDWKFKPPPNSIRLYVKNPLYTKYLKTSDRVEYGKKVRQTLEKLLKPMSKDHCVKDFLQVSEEIGKGCFGTVYRIFHTSLYFALKFSKCTSSALSKRNDVNNTCWHEIIILKNLFRPLITKNVCPNLPLIYDDFTCKECNIHIRDDKIKTPCVIYAVELANGDLKKFLTKSKPKSKEIYSALFQIMAGLHALQRYGQIMNFDVKKENVLYYDVKPGGYWKYRIYGTDYYVPNYGKMFILNDFGLSRPMSPNFVLYRDQKSIFRLGSRYAVVKDGKFVPINARRQVNGKGKRTKSHTIYWNGNKTTSSGSQYGMNRDGSIIDLDTKLTPEVKKFLEKKGVTTNPLSKDFFLSPDIIPPFEFYNDTQDAIRMFVGGKRTTQNGNHRKYPVITKSIEKNLSKYLGKGDSLKDLKFSTDPSQVLAGYFIQSFFASYKKKPKGEILGEYVIS